MSGVAQMEPCCASLAALAGQRQFRGISASLPVGASHLSGPRGEADLPSLFFRSVDAEDQGRVNPNPAVALTIETSIVITFCPFCGRRLIPESFRRGG